MTMKLISTVNLDSGGVSGANGLTILNIPQIYKDLFLVASIRSGRTAFDTDGVGFALNEATTTYAYIGVALNGTSFANLNTSYESFWAGMQPTVTNTAATFNNLEIYIPNYTSSFNKSYLQTSTAVSNIAAASSQLSQTAITYGSSSSAVTSLSIRSATSNGLAQFSAIWLYGIK